MERWARGQHRTLYCPVRTLTHANNTLHAWGIIYESSWFKYGTESCYYYHHLFLPLFPCWEQQWFQKMVQWQVKSHIFMPLLCFNTNSASVEFERLRHRIQRRTWAVLKTHNDAVDPKFCQIRTEICIRITKKVQRWIFIRYTQCLFAFLTKSMTLMMAKGLFEHNNDKGNYDTYVIWNYIFQQAEKENIWFSS